MEADLERRLYAVPDQEGLRAWRSPSRGVVITGLAAAPPSDGLFTPRGTVDDWEEIEPPAWDHDHCEFCWATFEDPARVTAKSSTGRRVVTEGYLVVGSGVESQKWICEECFEDFKDEFRWSVTNPSKGSSG
jgi:hypothetical protein